MTGCNAIGNVTTIALMTVGTTDLSSAYALCEACRINRSKINPAGFFYACSAETNSGATSARINA